MAGSTSHERAVASRISVHRIEFGLSIYLSASPPVIIYIYLSICPPSAQGGQVVLSVSLKKTKFANFDYINWPSWTTRMTWTNDFLRLNGKNKILKFWLYTVAKLDDQSH